MPQLNARFILKIDVENDTKRFFEASVILKSFRRWKQDALVAVLPQQSIYSPEHSRVIIDHKDKLSFERSIHLSDKIHSALVCRTSCKCYCPIGQQISSKLLIIA